MSERGMIPIGMLMVLNISEVGSSHGRGKMGGFPRKHLVVEFPPSVIVNPESKMIPTCG